MEGLLVLVSTEEAFNLNYCESSAGTLGIACLCVGTDATSASISPEETSSTCIGKGATINNNVISYKGNVEYEGPVEQDKLVQRNINYNIEFKRSTPILNPS